MAGDSQESYSSHSVVGRNRSTLRTVYEVIAGLVIDDVANVLGFLIEGRTTGYIAGKIHLAESTIRAHVHNIYRKAQVGSRMELLDSFEAYGEQLASKRDA